MASMQQEYEDAMATADVSLRELQRHATKLQNLLAAVGDAIEAGKPKSAKSAWDAAMARLHELERAMQSPDLNQWRGERGAAQNRARAQQEVLARKLAAAKALLLDLGWEPDALEQHLKANAPEGRDLARRSFRERGAAKRREAQRAQQEGEQRGAVVCLVGSMVMTGGSWSTETWSDLFGGRWQVRWRTWTLSGGLIPQTVLSAAVFADDGPCLGDDEKVEVVELEPLLDALEVVRERSDSDASDAEAFLDSLLREHGRIQ